MTLKATVGVDASMLCASLVSRFACFIKVLKPSQDLVSVSYYCTLNCMFSTALIFTGSSEGFNGFSSSFLGC